MKELFFVVSFDFVTFPTLDNLSRLSNHGINNVLFDMLTCRKAALSKQVATYNVCKLKRQPHLSLRKSVALHFYSARLMANDRPTKRTH